MYELGMSAIPSREGLTQETSYKNFIQKHARPKMFGATGVSIFATDRLWYGNHTADRKSTISMEAQVNSENNSDYQFCPDRRIGS